MERKHRNERPTRELLVRTSRGDREAFGEFYTRHRAVLTAYVMRRVGGADVAVDIVAETFARALLAVTRERQGPPDHPTAWLFAIAGNLLIDSARKQQVEDRGRRTLGMRQLYVTDADVERIVEVGSALDLMTEIRALVSDEELALLEARFVDEEPFSVIAERLECSEAVVRKRISRTRGRLETMIGVSRARRI